MSPGEVSALMFGAFAVLIIVRVPVSFALGLACIPVFILDDRLSPILLITEMWKSYNSFILLSVPFFLLSANLMNSAGITERLVNLAKTSVGVKNPPTIPPTMIPGVIRARAAACSAWRNSRHVDRW